MPAAIAIPLIVGAASAGTSLAAAKMQSNAANKASKLQIASTDKAQQFNERVYGDQRQLMQPYVSAGQTSLANLMAQHWGGQPSQYAPQGQQQPLQSGMGMPGAPMPQGGQAMRAPMSLAGMQGAPPPQAPPMGGQPQGGMVMMIGPDGTQKAIPQANVQQAIQRGARVVQ